MDWSSKLKEYARPSVAEYSDNLREGVINLSSGSPALGLMPIEQFQHAVAATLENKQHLAFQYGPSVGNPDLISWIADRYGVNRAEVMITSGSQQSLDLITKTFIDAGDSVVVERPTYTGALDVFSWAQANIVEARTVADIPPGNHKLIYVEPSYQNPTGRCWGSEQRVSFVESLNHTPSLVIEDAAYSDISFSTAQTSLRNLCPERVIYLGSLSKLLNPGVRLSYVIAPAEIIRRLNRVKQITDMASSYFMQQVAFEMLSTGMLDAHIKRLGKVYCDKKNLLTSALAHHCPELKFENPDGGFFLWAKCKIEASKLRNFSMRENISLVPGHIFYARTPDLYNIRLCYSRVVENQVEKIAKGLHRAIANC